MKKKEDSLCSLLVRRENCSVLLQKPFKNGPDEMEMKQIQIQRF